MLRFVECVLNSHEGRPHGTMARHGMRALNWAQRGPHLRVMGLQMGMEGFLPWAVCLQPRTEGSPLAGSAPSSTHGKIPTRGPRALNWARRGPHPRCVRPRKRTDESLFAGQASSSSHGGVPAIEPRILNRALCDPHLRRAVRPQLPRRGPHWRASPRQPPTEDHPWAAGSQPRT